MSGIHSNNNLAGSPWPSISIPWDEVKLGHMFDISNGSTPKSDKDQYWDGDILWATPTDVEEAEGLYIQSTNRTITEEGYNSCGTELVPAESIILTTRAPIGNVALAGTELCTNQGCKSIVPSKDIEPKFYYYSLLAAVTYLKTLGEGATFNELGTSDLKSIYFPKPPKNVQKQIADFLQYKEKQLENISIENNSLVTHLNEKKKSLRERYVLGEFSESSKEKTNNDLSVIKSYPQDWEVRRGKTLFTERDDRGYDDLPLLEVSLNHGVRLREDNEDRSAWVASDLKEMKRVAEGDLVFNKMRLWQGAIGKSEYEGLVSPDYTVLQPNQVASPTYYVNLLTTEAYKTEIDRRSYGVVDDRKRIYWNQFGDLPLLFPSPRKQELIVERLRQSTENIDNLIKKAEELNSLLSEKLHSLIVNAVTGQIDLDYDKHPSKQKMTS